MKINGIQEKKYAIMEKHEILTQFSFYNRFKLHTALIINENYHYFIYYYHKHISVTDHCCYLVSVSYNNILTWQLIICVWSLLSGEHQLICWTVHDNVRIYMMIWWTVVYVVERSRVMELEQKNKNQEKKIKKKYFVDDFYFFVQALSLSSCNICNGFIKGI